eukprot:13979476-Heterocapsa_arctica.AAC.1
MDVAVKTLLNVARPIVLHNSVGDVSLPRIQLLTIGHIVEVPRGVANSVNGTIEELALIEEPYGSAGRANINIVNKM